MDLRLKGKIAIVSGGASNIGRAISITLAREGANVVIADIDQKQAEKVVDTIKSEGNTAIAIKTDITKYDQVEAMVNQTVQQFGQVDILVNNLGWGEPQYFIETDPALWEKVINLNFVSLLNCCKLVLPHMIERKSGAIVSIGSDAGRTGDFKVGVYAGCKAALITFSKSIAKEVGRYGIRLNVVCPGVTPGKPDEVGQYSAFADSVPDADMLEKITKQYPLRRLGQPKDVADMVAFLASDSASYVTGQTVSVSGGYTML